MKIGGNTQKSTLNAFTQNAATTSPSNIASQGQSTSAHTAANEPPHIVPAKVMDRVNES